MKQWFQLCPSFFLLLIGSIFALNEPRSVEELRTVRYEPTWSSLDTRPIPSWFDEVKIGIFVHWGVYSVPSFESEWFWDHWKNDRPRGKFATFMKKNYPPDFSYPEFARDFTAEFFDPDKWAKLFKKSGAKYVILTSKHHEGYTLWPSKYSFGWNVQDIGPHRDLIGDLAQAVKKKGLTFGVYHSLFEWFNPLYLADKSNSFTTQDFVNNKLLPELHELINNYQPSILWANAESEASDTYFKSREFLAWLYNDSPVKDTILVNDRWGIGVDCKHGDFYSTCKDYYKKGVLPSHKWENAMTLDRESWGYRRNADISQYLTINELLQTLVQTISYGGNLLINIGATKEGTIPPIFQERLLQLGEWLSINGEAIYKSKPWTVQNDTLTSGVWYTTDGGTNVYAIVLQWPENNNLLLESIVPLFTASDVTVSTLGNVQKLKWTLNGKKVQIQFLDKAIVNSQWSWVLKITTKH